MLEGIPHGNVVLATNTLYRGYKPTSEQRLIEDTDGIRGDLALAAIRNTLALGNSRIVLADGGSSTEFICLLKPFATQGLTVVTGMASGRAPQRRATFKEALSLPDVKVIIYSQAEKDLSPFIDKIAAPILENKADIVIPSRPPEVLGSWPKYQIDSELEVNASIDRILRRYGLIGKNQNFDWFFGPIVYSTREEVSKLFLDQYSLTRDIKSKNGVPDPEKHSGSHYLPVIRALALGMRVASVEIPYFYPELQMLNETTPERIAEFQKRRITDGRVYRLEILHAAELHSGGKNSAMTLATT